MSRLRLEFATEGFLTSMSREFTKRYAEDPSPIRTFDEYSEADRSSLMLSLGHAMKRMKAENDNAFAAWSAKRAAVIEGEP